MLSLCCCEVYGAAEDEAEGGVVRAEGEEGGVEQEKHACEGGGESGTCGVVYSTVVTDSSTTTSWVIDLQLTQK